jgi:putative transposase
MSKTWERKRYSTDLSDAEWKLVAPLLPPPKQTGRKREVNEREVLNAIFYLLHNGCIWRDLPKDLPPWQTVYKYFRRWQSLGVWQQLHAQLRQQVRQVAGKAAQPTAAIVDSQSVKTTEKKGRLMAMMAASK